MKTSQISKIFLSVAGLLSGLFFPASHQDRVHSALSMAALNPMPLSNKMAEETSAYDDQNPMDFSQLDSVSAYTVAGPNNPINVVTAT